MATRRELEILREELTLRLDKASRDYLDAVIRKYEIKQHYQQSHDDRTVAVGKMIADSRYRIASEDWRDSMVEMTALAPVITLLNERLRS